ncbi:HK97 family phage prohead protease [Roseovarius sp.]|uniref:HK97 family phage prohead protease n=1 Tax=Roseovarius sp. TaxID=1486281 RepID=UPI003BAC327E
MLFGAYLEGGGLEVRRRSEGGVRLAGRFPYRKTATLSDGGRTGRPKKEVFEPRAFAFRVDDPTKEIHLLVGHDFNRPLASKLTGTLALTDSDDALTFTADVAEEISQTSYGKDVIAQIGAGLAFGISPGFRIPPQRAVAEPEFIEEEPDDGTLDENGDPRRGALIRHVREALLYELSIVVRPAFKDSEVEKRNWEPGPVLQPSRLHAVQRWR